MPDLGPGVVPITGTWQFHTGDDRAWAQPGFDDSGWQALSASKPWGEQGHSGYTGYAWYRKRVEIGASDQPLGVFVPPAGGAYEVYWNGKLIGSSGSLPPHAVWYEYGQNAVFSLGGQSVTGGVLALRFWAPPEDDYFDLEKGGLHGPPQMGLLAEVQQHEQLGLLRREHRLFPSSIATALVAVGALLSLLFFLRQRREWLFLWVTLLLTGTVVSDLPVHVNRAVSAALIHHLNSLGSTCKTLGVWLTLLWFFGLNGSRRWRLTTRIAIGIYFAAQVNGFFFDQFWKYPGRSVMLRADDILSPITAGLALFPLVMIGFGLARHKSSWLVPLSVAAALDQAWSPAVGIVGQIQPSISDAMIRWSLELGGYQFHATTLLNWLLILTVAFTVVRRQVKEGRRQAHLEQEIRSAQEVQNVLIPEEIPATPGLAVASIYKPATEVGGDFFQVIPPEPDSPDSGTLIIVGDVSGKGLKAAMTVSLIVGTLRTLADATRSPKTILAGLNRRLLGRTQGGFATCIVLRIDADGTATLANAGHLSPFRNGLEWEVPASLPLGLTPDAEYDEVRTHLREAETLTLITDGVLEARNRKGELFGFERVAELMREKPSASQIAEAACAFGQDDDITVISIKREAHREPQPLLSLYALPVLE